MTLRFAQLVLAACVLQHVTLGGGIHPLDGRTFAAVLDNLANEGLGVDEYQMAESLSAKFTEWIEAVERLRDVIESGYGDMTTTRSLPECCTAPLGEKDVRFKQRVNKELLCAVGDALNGSSVTYVNHDDVIRVMKENLETAPSLKWQYFSTEEGVLFDYPTFSYCPVTYDPRFRSWYVEVTSPLPKDLVIVVDTSDSMRKLHQGRSLMQIAIEAAATVVDTLGPNDRVGVVAFSDQPQTPPGNLRTSICYSNTLAMATPRNKHYLTNDFLMNLRADGGTHYAPALKKAFEYFIKTPSVSTDRTVREKAIIFLTDGEPTDTREVVMQTLRDENAKLGNKVTMFMFGLGEGSMWHTLNDMAMQTTADVKAGEVKRGHFIRVSDPSDLRSKMGSYYTYFSKTGSQPRVTFSVPYYDFFGIGVVISGCLPVFYDSQLKGVVCIDRTVSDLLSDVTYFNKGELNYAFVIDGQARVLTHPMLPRPRTIRDDPLFIRLPSLERSPQVLDVMTSMMRGESGTQTFVSQRVTSRGDTMSEGVDVHDVLSHYFWSSVALTWFSVCVVVAEDTEFVRSVFDKDHPPPFVYHRLDLRSPRNKCRHFNRVALRDVTSVKFAPTAFVDAYEYLDTEETKTMVDRYELYMAGTPNTLDSYFKDGVRESVAETFRLDAILSARPARYAIWRYIGTEAGVFRQLPGTRMLKEFDHTQQPWYKRSVSMKGVITLSTSRGDKAEAGSTVTLSRSIYQGRSSQQHTNKDPISAVMGMDIKMSYLYRLMLDTFPACSSPNNRRVLVTT
ncbi:VWFA and cache domain-containing protein 1 [Lamellibrachia satsuma]|nr:VWFA and cache domain-containing protein 1 [Lamellibrachia satsuma]